MPEHLPGSDLDLLRGRRGLDLFRQVQQEQPPMSRFVVFLAEVLGSEGRTFEFDARRIIERSDDEFFPTPLADRVDDSPVEASSEPPSEPAARVIAKRAHLVRQFHPEELRDLLREIVIKAVFPAPASDVWVVSLRKELLPGCVVPPVGSPSKEVSGWFSWSRRNSSLNPRVFVSKDVGVSAMSEFWRKRVYGLRRTGRGQCKTQDTCGHDSFYPWRYVRQRMAPGKRNAGSCAPQVIDEPQFNKACRDEKPFHLARTGRPAPSSIGQGGTGVGASPPCRRPRRNSNDVFSPSSLSGDSYLVPVATGLLSSGRRCSGGRKSGNDGSRYQGDHFSEYWPNSWRREPLLCLRHTGLVAVATGSSINRATDYLTSSSWRLRHDRRRCRRALPLRFAVLSFHCGRASDFNIFTGLTLAAGQYYLIITSPFNSNEAKGWRGTDTTPDVILAPGVTQPVAHFLIARHRCHFCSGFDFFGQQELDRDHGTWHRHLGHPSTLPAQSLV